MTLIRLFCCNIYQTTTNAGIGLKAYLLAVLLCLNCIFAISTYASPNVIKIALLDEQTVEDNSGSNFEQLNKFIVRFWQRWATKNQQDVTFVYLAGEQVFSALARGDIDVVGLTTITGEDPDNLYSVPYAKFKQRVFKRLNNNNADGIQLAIHSPRETTLNFLGKYIERAYFSDVEEMLKHYQDYDALYSIMPWTLENKLSDLNLASEFYISTDDAPEIYFHFAVRKENRALMYQINDSLRAVSKVQAQQWTKAFIRPGDDNFSFTLGEYIENITEAEKQYVLDNNIIVSPIFPTGFPPFVITNSLINITERGLTMDILKHATKRTGLIFTNIYADTLSQGAQQISQGQADFWALRNKGQSKNYQSYLYSKSYFDSHINIVHRLEAPMINHVNQLNGKVVAAVKGVGITKYLQEQLPSATIKQFNSIADAIKAVANADADIYLGEALNNAYIIKHERLSNLVSKPIQGLSYKAQAAFAAPEKHGQLITLLNRALSSISETEFDNMYAAWSKTAFITTDAKAEVRDAYERASIVLGVMILTIIFITRFYIRQINFRKASQQEVEEALAVAQAARKEAERSAQAKINFLARMSHEIRTPMNGILGMAESLTFTKLSDEQKNYLSTLTDSADNLLVLLNDILDFAKMDAGKLILEAQPANISELAELALKTVAHVEKEKNISLKLTLDNALHHRYVTDPFRLTQVLNNLMSNAVKFTDKGKVQLSVFLVDRHHEDNVIYDTLKFSVKDSGIGISDEKQKNLFNPFTQADSAVTRNYGGTGLGLSICQEIANAMGSKIELKSTANIGSDFYFYLTLKQAVSVSPANERRKIARRDVAPDSKKFNQLKVLMAEDNIVNVKVLSAQLERLGIHPDVAENGQQALMMFEQSPYDIVISDCHMPELDGYELAGLLSKKKQQNNPWLIAITADALEGTAEKCLAAGFDDYIAKPCTQETVNNKMHHAMRQIIVDDITTITLDVSGLTLFSPTRLLSQHGQDIKSAQQYAQSFIELWQAERDILFNATLAKDFHHIHGLVQQLALSIQYLADDSIASNADLIVKQTHALQADAIEYTVKLFMKELDTLHDEVLQWLA